MLEPYQKKIVEMLYKQEMLLAKIYKMFADQFPEKSKFWNDLHSDEKKHAQMIKKLYQAEKKDLVMFNEGKTKTYTMETMIKYIEETIEEAAAGKFTLQRAISYTLDFERALIEKNAFKMFTTDNEKVQGVMTRLDKETRSHMTQAEELKKQL